MCPESVSKTVQLDRRETPVTESSKKVKILKIDKCSGRPDYQFHILYIIIKKKKKFFSGRFFSRNYKNKKIK